jgi:flagellar hook-length control protein FliK
MAATLGLRIAAGATDFVSQPRAALASMAPDAVQQAKTATPDLAASERSLAASDAAALAKPAAPAIGGAGDALLAAAAKPLALASALLPNPQSAPATTADTSSATDAASAGPQAAALAATPQPALTNANAGAIAAQVLPMASHAAAEQVAMSLRQAVSNGNDHIQIQLQPADLGAVAVKLSINHDGRVTMVVSADRSDTLNLLQQNSGSLTQALRDAGLSADSSSLSFNLRGGSQFNQQSAAGNAGSGGSADDLIATAAAAEPPPAARRALHSGSLDIHV